MAESPRKSAPAYAIASVDNALKLASALQLEGGMTVTKAADRLSVAPSTAHRLLQMLVFRDFARQGDDRAYYAGPALQLPAHSPSRTSRLRSVSEKHLRRLTEMTKETSTLGIRLGDRARIVLAVEPHQALTAGARDGMDFSAWRTTHGRLGLAELDPADVDDLFANSQVDPPDLSLLKRDLRSIRRQGFAMNKERSDRGVVAVGVPVHDAGGEFLAGIATAMPFVRYAPEMLPGLVATLRRVARDIESDLVSAQG